MTALDGDEEAVETANETPFGLAGGIWTRSMERAPGLPRRIQTGTAWLDAHRAVGSKAPFGGSEGSGLDRGNGIAAIHGDLETRSAVIGPRPNIDDPFTLRQRPSNTAAPEDP